MRLSQQELKWLAEDFYHYMERECTLGSWTRSDLNDKYQEYRNLKKCLSQKAINFGTVLYYMCRKRPKYAYMRNNVVTFFNGIRILPGQSYFKNNQEGIKRKSMLPHKISLGQVLKRTFSNHSESVSAKTIQFDIHNDYDGDLRVRDVFFLRNKTDFFMEDEDVMRRVQLSTHKSITVKITCMIRDTVGITSTEVCFLFVQNGHEYLGSQKIEFNVIDDVVEELKALRPYVRKQIREENNARAIVDTGERPKYENTSQLENERGLQRNVIPANIKHCYQGRRLKTDATTKYLIKNPISAENYIEKFRLLLQIEELQNRSDIRKYTMEDVHLDKRPNGLMEIVVPGLAEKRPSVLRGDRVHVSLDGNEYEIYRGFVHETGLNTIKVHFGRRMLQQHFPGQMYNVEFTLNTLPFTIMHRSLDIVMRETRWLQVLNPTSEKVHTDSKYGGKLVLFNRILESNAEQLQTINNIVNHKLIGAPYVIFGPPGTGKTVTVVEAIKQVHKLEPTSHILVCAPSNSACDLLVDRLMASGRIEKREMFRMNAVSRHYEHIESEVVRSVSNYDPATGFFYFPCKATLMKYRVIVCTLITAGRLASAKFPDNHFTDIFVDEAGYAMEPECLVALAGIIGSQSRIVLAGDCMQLGPIIHNKLAAKKSLGMSMLERLTLKCDFYSKAKSSSSRTTTKLLNNYRSHEAILKVPNELYYENELRVCADIMQRMKFCRWEGLPLRNFPIVFNGIQGKDEREENSPSYFNAYEVSAVLSHVKNLLQGNITVKASDIGIITPYYKQVSKIRRELEKLSKRREFNKVREIKVGTVEEFQGQERMVIIISTVRSSEEYLHFDKNHHLGFVQNPKRFNVAITRAKSLLIIVGNPRLLSMDPNWRALLDHCIRSGGYKGFEFTLDDSDEEFGEEDSDEEFVEQEIEETPFWLQEK